MTIRRAQEKVMGFLETRDENWTPIDNLFPLFTHMSGETGEVARDVINTELSLSPDRTTGEPMSKHKDASMIKDDPGDLMYRLIKIAIA